jgi:hypothetical protein
LAYAIWLNVILARQLASAATNSTRS